jgi:glucosylceramidase
LIDTGGGISTVAILPRGGDVAERISVFAPDRLQRLTPDRPVGMLRHGNQVTFYLAPGAFSQAARLQVKVFASTGAPVWRRILAARATDQASVRVDHTKLSCPQTTTLGSQLFGLATRVLPSDVRRQQRALRALRSAIGHRAGLGRDASQTTARIAQLRRQIAEFGGLASAVQAAGKACAAPPATSAPTTTTTTATTTTATTTGAPTPPGPPSPGPPPPPPPAGVEVVQTDAALSQQMASQPSLSFSTAPPSGVPVVGVNEQLAYQRFAGAGAALTDSGAWLIHNQLSPADQTRLMQELFGSSGIHLDFLRIGMGATGAMTVGPSYSYDDEPSGKTDPTLADFSISHDVPYIIPTLKQALGADPGLEILANPWSPPGWMKTNDSLGNQNDSGTLNTTADPAVEDQLAQYFVKFIQAYAAQGIPIAALTPQNEPRTPPGAGTTYPGLTLPASQEAEFITNHLAPALNAAGLHPKIYGNDLSWDQTAYASTVATGAASDLAGIAWHCYFGSPTVMSQLQQTSPNLDQIVDECSPEIRGFGAPEFLISTLRNWASVVSVWTAATDPTGGPIQPGNNCNGCRGLVTIDQNAHTVTLRNEYYQVGQVSAFVQQGARRIDSPNFVTYGTNSSNIETVSPGLDDVAFLNPDGSKVLVTYNNSSTPISFAVQSDGRYFSYTIPAQAMTTFVWR